MNLTTDQERARGLLVSLQGMHSGNAHSFVLHLDDNELAAIVAAAPQHHNDHERAKREVRDILARARERRDADQGRAGLPIVTELDLRNGARELLQLHCGLSADDAALHESRLTAEQRSTLGKLAARRRAEGGDPISADQLRAIIAAS